MNSDCQLALIAKRRGEMACWQAIGPLRASNERVVDKHQVSSQLDFLRRVTARSMLVRCGSTERTRVQAKESRSIEEKTNRLHNCLAMPASSPVAL